MVFQKSRNLTNANISKMFQWCLSVVAHGHHLNTNSICLEILCVVLYAVVNYQCCMELSVILCIFVHKIAVCVPITYKLIYISSSSRNLYETVSI